MTLVPSHEITSIRWWIAEVQPADAQRWLGALRHPRPVRPSLMRAYARDMITGHWQLNGVPLIFDRGGRLLDGQTRLEACIAAVRGFRTLIVENVGPEAFVTIDNTRHRALGAILGLRQETGGAILASTLIFVWQYYFNSRDNLRFRPSVPELLYILEARPQIREELALAKTYRAVIRPSVATALLHLGGRVDRSLTQAFLDDLANEALSDPSHPAVAFRNAVARMPESAFDTLDLGRRRGFCEILRANGERNVTSVAAATRVLWMLENAPDGRKVPSPTELLDYFDRVSAIRKSAGNFRAKFKGMMHGSASAALHFIFSREDAGKADEFFARLRDGANLDKSSPILMLRNRLIESDLSAATVVSEREKMALTIKAWRAFIDGKPLRSLRWVERGPQAEPFPDLGWRAEQ